MKKNTLYITLGIGLAILLSSFRGKKITKPSVITQDGKPSGQKTTYLKPDGVVFNRDMNISYTNNSNSFIEVSITSEQDATYNIVYGMNFGNGQPGIVFKNETTFNPK
jgi:hypothetical protein